MTYTLERPPRNALPSLFLLFYRMTHRAKSPWKTFSSAGLPKPDNETEKGVFLAIMRSICLRLSTRMSSRPSIRLNASKNPFAGSGPCVDSIAIAFFFFSFQDRKEKLKAQIVTLR